MKVELRGLHVFGYHGVEEEEQRLGQLFLFDVELEVGERGADDRLEDAVDYTQVAAVDPRAVDRAAVQPARGARDARSPTR